MFMGDPGSFAVLFACVTQLSSSGIGAVMAYSRADHGDHLGDSPAYGLAYPLGALHGLLYG